MEYLRRYLIFARKSENRGLYKWKFSTIMLSLSIIGILIGFLLDYLLPFGYFPNMLRGIISLVTGFFLFTFGYLKMNSYTEMKVSKDELYQRMRERLSFKQRVNFSIVLGAITVAFLAIGDLDNWYTFRSILSIFVAITLISFCRRRRSEFVKDVNEIPDFRDARQEHIKRTKIKEKEIEKAEKKLKKETKKK